MKSFSIALSALAFVVPAVFAVPTLVPIAKVAGAVKADSYIIKLKQGSDKNGHLGKLAQILTTAESHVKYDYDSVFHGYAGTLKGAALDFIRSSKDVEYIYPDQIVSISDFEAGTATVDADAVVAAADLDVGTLAANGGGVDVIGIDTGIYTAHSSFGGRARWGATFGGYANSDGNGHGTHTAGTVGGSGFGPATAANIIAVKVLSDSGSGSNSDVIAGVNWAVSNAASSGRPTIATMSLGGGSYQPLDDAINSGISRGVHFTVAAGNSNVDAINTSPARVANAVTVGAIDSNNAKASFSNFGSIVDVHALGVNVRSAWIGSTSAVNTISGTSMATPAVAGILAVAIGNYGNKTPAALATDLKNNARSIATGFNSATTKLVATQW
ncbi:hypothetical protein BOTBODRAFT_55912 [Botryobasidium botryosum FD-172 SS1]|uniref:Peptidase S8/S53 domain-containing protein n=1 Tax=Botryobasidium botryosum (strain FD-172 SS1) TaxID=930990 RepID=A0A067MG22_BOTB1|nr:hypothetical protein BOTBODRAFT_55912 [Botryobasidium botryosum FD-172 SS1]